MISGPYSPSIGRHASSQIEMSGNCNVYPSELWAATAISMYSPESSTRSCTLQFGLCACVSVNLFLSSTSSVIPASNPLIRPLGWRWNIKSLLPGPYLLWAGVMSIKSGDFLYSGYSCQVVPLKVPSLRFWFWALKPAPRAVLSNLGCRGMSNSHSCIGHVFLFIYDKWPLAELLMSLELSLVSVW